jgi:hypothetical protein
VDTNPQTAQISIVLDYEIFLEILCNSKMFSHETMINVLVVQELLKEGDED